MCKGNKKNASCPGHTRKIRSHLAILCASRTIWFTVTLVILSMCSTAFARDLPQYVAPGETITLTAPSGYMYQWIKYDSSGHGTIDGMAQTCTIYVPTSAQTDDILSAAVTLTEAYGSGPSCIGYQIIYLQVRQFSCPNLDDFCYHTAQPADAAKFMYNSFPTVEGFIYAWSGDGLDGTKLSATQSDIQTYLNTLGAGQYTASLTVSHGTRTAWTCSDVFDVFGLPSGAITIPV